MSQWQNSTWYQQTLQQQSNVVGAVKGEQQYTYQIPAQPLTGGRPYVPSDYDSSAMGKMNRSSPLIANMPGPMQSVQSVGAVPSTILPAGNISVTAGIGSTVPNVGGTSAGGTGLQQSLHAHAPVETPAGLASIQSVPRPQVTMVPQPQAGGGNGLITTLYMQVPVQHRYHPHPGQLPVEYAAYQGANYQIHPEQWNQLALGLSKPGDAPLPVPLAQMKRKSSKSSASTPAPKDAAFNATALSGVNTHHKITKRSRMGCLTCRLRKKRCCETKPKCSECLRLGLNCVWPKPGTEHKNKPKEVKREENMIQHDIYGKIKVLRGIVEYRSS